MRFKMLNMWPEGIFIVFVSLVYGIVCAPVQYWDDDDLPNSKVTPLPLDRWTPFPWDRWTPFPWDRWTPYPWDRRTPYPWNKITVPPYERFTFPPDTYRSTNDSFLLVVIFVPLAIGLVLLFGITYFCKNYGCCAEDESAYMSSRTLHAPPRSTAIAVPPYRTNEMTIEPPLSTGVPVRLSTTVVPSVHASNNTIIPSAPVGSWIQTSDKPPDYSAVVLGDLTQQDKFPEVKPTTKLDSPPPKYDEKILPKF